MMNQDIVEQSMEEISRLGNYEFLVPLDLSSALSLCASLQLSLRHPDNHGAAAKLARAIIDHICAELTANGYRHWVAMIRMGDDPANDVVT